MKIYFRVDASVHIGSGHVMRCLSLANELQRHGYDVVFVMRPQLGDLCDFTQNRGFKVEKLPKPAKFINPKSTDDYKAWLQVTVIQDVEDYLSIAVDADLVVIDHYGINIEWESRIRSSMPCKLIAIDDLVREHNVDLIIDQTYGTAANEYLLTSTASHVLAGSKFALLNTQFAKLHSLAVKKNIDKKNHRLLLTMGRVDNPNATLKVLIALSLRKNPVETTVLLSENSPHYNSVASFCEQHKEWVKHISFTKDMATLMLKHTIAIGAPGSTSWERACMGLPSIIVPLAKNQLQICQNLVDAKAALSLPLENITNLLNFKIDELLGNFEMMRSNCLGLCDGKGCMRVVEKINKLVLL